MDSIEVDQNEDFRNEMLDEPSATSDSGDAHPAFGRVDLVPSRVGDEYQVEPPLLISEHEYLAYSRSPFEEGNRVELPCDFLMGLPVPVTWISEEVEDLKGEKEESLCDLRDPENSERSTRVAGVKNDSSELKREHFGVRLEDEKINNDFLDGKMHQIRSRLVPGHPVDSWSDIEKASFLLGLYIFEKDFVQVKRFIENKKMGDILSFYYGTFYRSNEYRRWSEGHRIRSRRCVYGQRIFSGLRQQELLSRLFSRVSEECQNALLEVSRTFGDGRISLEEYVSLLKGMVGMNNLVDATGIGKGKQDLTGTAIEPSRSNQAIQVRPEIPIGKACSSLTPREIIKFLTGDYRLSKARSSDLFWEAVWPRLLARGWHSEQPNCYNYAGNSKHALVFLVPEVKKFSRRRLVKGDHYFDSVTDVLNKVASEPELLELEKEENEGNGETKLDETDDLPEKRRHCYLQPRTPNQTTEVMKFTIVDTSLGNGTLFKVRELKALPLETSEYITLTSHYSNENPCELVSTEESDCADTMSLDHEISEGREECYEKKDIKQVGSSDNGSVINGSDFSTHASGKNLPSHNVVREGKKHPKALKANLSSRRPKQDNLGHFAPVGKRRRRLTACSRAEMKLGMSNSMQPIVERDMLGCLSGTTPDLSENVIFHVSSSQAKLSLTPSSSRGSSIESREEEEHPCQVPQTRTLIDLNFPLVPLDFENTDLMIVSADVEDCQRKMNLNDPAGVEKASTCKANPEQQSNMNSRRQSTRNRPPTARALEALANGFLTINSRRKHKDDNTRASTRSIKTMINSQDETRFSEFITSDASVMPKEDESMQCNGDDSDLFGGDFMEKRTSKLSDPSTLPVQTLEL